MFINIYETVNDSARLLTIEQVLSDSVILSASINSQEVIEVPINRTELDLTGHIIITQYHEVEFHMRIVDQTTELNSNITNLYCVYLPFSLTNEFEINGLNQLTNGGDIIATALARANYVNIYHGIIFQNFVDLPRDQMYIPQYEDNQLVITFAEFLKMNIMHNIDVRCETVYSGNTVSIRLIISNKIDYEILDVPTDQFIDLEIENMYNFPSVLIGMDMTPELINSVGRANQTIVYINNQNQIATWTRANNSTALPSDIRIPFTIDVVEFIRENTSEQAFEQANVFSQRVLTTLLQQMESAISNITISGKLENGSYTYNLIRNIQKAFPSNEEPILRLLGYKYRLWVDVNTSYVTTLTSLEIKNYKLQTLNFGIKKYNLIERIGR